MLLLMLEVVAAAVALRRCSTYHRAAIAEVYLVTSYFVPAEYMSIFQSATWVVIILVETVAWSQYLPVTVFS